MKIYKVLLPAVCGLTLASCSEEKLGPTIFPTEAEVVDPNSYTYKFDRWLEKEFLLPYNVEFKYRMEDIEANMDYNLVPAKFENARDLCALTKYLWYDTYEEATGSKEFIMNYGPRILHLIGSPAYNPTVGTETLGEAEGGLKVTLFKVNELNLENTNMLNEYFFRTMHHEFGHILHQTRTYPTEFNLLSPGRYDSGTWQNKPIGLMASQGFITPYASCEQREDFAETIANYITRFKDQDDLILWMADRGWTNGIEETTTTSDPNRPYYCMYYLKDVNKPDEKTYFLSSLEKDEIYNKDYKVALIGLNNRVLNTVEEVEAYIEEVKAQFPDRVFYVEDTDKVDGRDIIMQKRSIVRKWFSDAWNLDFDKLREIVQRRQGDFDIEALRAEIDAIK